MKSVLKYVVVFVLGIVFGCIIAIAIPNFGSIITTFSLDDLLSSLGIITLVILSLATIVDILQKFFNIDLTGQNKKTHEKMKSIVNEIIEQVNYRQSNDEAIVSFFQRQEEYLEKHYRSVIVESGLKHIALLPKDFKSIKCNILDFHIKNTISSEEKCSAIEQILVEDKAVYNVDKASPVNHFNVKYYIDLNTYFYQLYISGHEFFYQLCDNLILLIKQSIDSQTFDDIGTYRDIDKILIPENGNLILGAEIAKSFQFHLLK